MRWLAMGTYDVRVHPRAGVVVEGLRAHGHTVTEIVEPLDLPTAQRVELVRRPWRLLPVVRRVLGLWRRLARQTWPILTGREGEVPDAVLVGYLGHLDVLLVRLLVTAARLRRLRHRRPLVVLDHLVSAAGTAADRGLASGASAKARLLSGLDRAALAAADVVLLDTLERFPELPRGRRSKGVVTPVGATAGWFAAGEQRPAAAAGPVTVVFVGLFTPLQGTDTIAAALVRLRPQLEQGAIAVTLVGGGQDHTLVRRMAGTLPGVTWVDWVDAADLPAFEAGFDVALGIFGTTHKALTVVPNKVFQAAAAGCAVVTSDTAPQRRLLGDAAVLVAPGDPVALAEALGALAADRVRAVDLGRAARALALTSFTPYAVVEHLLDRLADRADGAGVSR